MRFSACSPCCLYASLSRRPGDVNWRPSVRRPMRQIPASMNKGRSIMPESNYPLGSGTLQEQTGTAAVEQRQADKSPGYVVGVDVGGTNLRLALADMLGN